MPGQFATWQGRNGVWEARPLTPAPSEETETLLQVRSAALSQQLCVSRRVVLGEGLRRGYFAEADRAAYLKAWSQPGALTGGLNYYRAALARPPADAPSGSARPRKERSATQPAPFTPQRLTMGLNPSFSSWRLAERADAASRYGPT